MTPQLVPALAVLYRQMVRNIDRALSEVDLTFDQWRALRLLGDNPGLTMREMSDGLAIPAPTTTRLIDSHVARSLIDRRPSVVDRRRVEVTLTRAGAELLTQADRIVAGYEAELRERAGRSAYKALFQLGALVEPVSDQTPEGRREGAGQQT